MQTETAFTTLIEAEDGELRIKPEYLMQSKPRAVNTELLSEEDKALLICKNGTTEPNGTDSNSGPQKPGIKLKGQNKKRPPPMKFDSTKQVCPSLIDVLENEEPRPCRYLPNCKFRHDIDVFMKERPKDVLPGGCYNYRTMGRCVRGLTCLFGEEHITAEGKNKINPNLISDAKSEYFNFLSKDLQTKLRKKKYVFDEANKVLKTQKGRPNSEALKVPVSKTEAVTITSSEVMEPTTNKTLSTTITHNEMPFIKHEPVDIGSSKVTESATNMSQSSNITQNEGPFIKNEIETESNEFTEPAAKKICLSAASTEAVVIKTQQVDGANNEVKKEPCFANHSLSDTTNCEASIIKTESMPTLSVEATGSVGKKVSLSFSGPFTDEDVISVRSEEKKKIDWRGKLYLAPLTTVGNLPFRRLCKKLGADITCGEMAMADTLVHGGNGEWALVRRHSSEDIFGVQICGNNPHILAKCGQLLQENTELDFIDLNLGCPIDQLYQKGAGSGLMRRTGPLEASIKALSQLLRIPFTVKMRKGVYADKPFAHELVQKCRDWGVSMVTIHGRSREQRYTKLADWDYISKCVEAADPMPIFGNGDIMSFEDYEKDIETSNAAGVMIARGALIKPWIFTEIKERRHWDISSTERFQYMKDFVNFGLEHWGSDSQGVERTRRFLLEWQSFAHRYVPVGLLERPPQRINMRPPAFRGRDDLETLLASPNAGDWIKICEMLLGPAPDGFQFLPKHKANSWK